MANNLHGPLVFTEIRTFTSTGDITMANEAILNVNKTVGAATGVTLPPNPSRGRTLWIKDAKGDANTNNITITPDSGTIDGAANQVISTNYGAMLLQYNGSEWSIISPPNQAVSATLADDALLSFGGVARISYDTTDANANALFVQLPAGGGTDVPVIAIGQSIESVDLGLYNGVVDPRIAMFGVGAVTTGPVIEFRKARGTISSPTVVTSGDDLGTISFHGAVAAGEYVQSATIRADLTGTVATTRGPGNLSFNVATDAAPSVLTERLLITASGQINLTPATDVTVANGTGLIVGHTAQETVSAGDGSTDLVPEVQVLGTTQADSSILLACFSTTATRAAAPTIALVKGGNAAIGSHTIVTDNEVVGNIIGYADDGVDLETPVASIQFVVDGTPAGDQVGGSVEIYTTADGGSTLTQAMVIGSNQRVLIGASGAPQSLLDVRGAAGAPGLLYLASNETTVVDGDVLGRINFNAPLEADGTDAIAIAAAIWAEADATFGATVNTTDLVLATGTSEAATEKWRITADGELTSLGAAPANVAADGAVLASGGIAFTDVLNAWIDDATHGDGTTSTFIGNETIDTTAPSDRLLKKNITPTKVEALPKILALEMVDFDWRSEADTRRQFGWIAQQVQQVIPELVAPQEGAGGLLYVKKHHLVTYLVKAIQELHSRLEALEKPAA